MWQILVQAASGVCYSHDSLPQATQARNQASSLIVFYHLTYDLSNDLSATDLTKLFISIPTAPALDQNFMMSGLL